MNKYDEQKSRLNDKSQRAGGGGSPVL